MLGRETLRRHRDDAARLLLCLVPCLFPDVPRDRRGLGARLVLDLLANLAGGFFARQAGHSLQLALDLLMLSFDRCRPDVERLGAFGQLSTLLLDRPFLAAQPVLPLADLGLALRETSFAPVDLLAALRGLLGGLFLERQRLLSGRDELLLAQDGDFALSGGTR